MTHEVGQLSSWIQADAGMTSGIKESTQLQAGFL